MADKQEPVADLVERLTFRKQLFRHDPESGVHGDCGRAVIASLLGLPLESVPHEHREMTGAEFNAQRDGFLRSRGVTRIWLGFQADSVAQAVDWATQWSNGMHFVLMGKSPRGSNHVVIGHEGKIVHDPHPDGGDITGPTDNGQYYVEWLVSPASTLTAKEAEIETWKWAVGAKDKQILEFADALEAAQSEATHLRRGIEKLINNEPADQSLERVRDRLKAILEEENTAGEATDLREQVKGLRKALKPFADMLNRYDLGDDDLITLTSNFFGRLNVTRAEHFIRARKLLEAKTDG